MSSGYCSLEDAFALPGDKKPVKKDKESKRKYKDIPAALSGAPEVVPEPMVGSGPDGKMDAIDSDTYFPLPGETARSDEWASAFTLDAPRIDGSVPVEGKPTLWRDAAVAAPPIKAASQSGQSNLEQRLDALTRQLEALSTANPMQSTAELFLFIAIGLLFLLAIDTLLRFATTIAVSKTRMRSGGRGVWPKARWR